MTFDCALLVAERALSCFLQLEVNGNDRCSIAGTQAQAEKDITQALDEAHRAFKLLSSALPLLAPRAGEPHARLVF